MRGSPLEEGSRWLRQAEADLHWATHLADEGGFHIACFLAQQVAEKALKALLYANGAEVVLGHSVARLLMQVHEARVDFEGSDVWAELDGYYLPTRYPNSVPDAIPADVYTRASARRAVEMATAVVDAVRSWMRKKEQ